MSDSFEKAERSCFNLTHYAKLIPESHAVFVMPPGGSRSLRRSSIEEGMSHRFTMFNLEQSDIINGRGYEHSMIGWMCAKESYYLRKREVIYRVARGLGLSE